MPIYRQAQTSMLILDTAQIVRTYQQSPCEHRCPATLQVLKISVNEVKLQP